MTKKTDKREFSNQGEDGNQATALPGDLEDWLGHQTYSQLSFLLLDIYRRHPELIPDKAARAKSAKTNATLLLRNIREKVSELSNGPNSIDEDDYDISPDFESLAEMMEEALPLGVADELLDILAGLFETIMGQMFFYNHNDIPVEIVPCYEVAVKLLRVSSMTTAQKLFWAIEQTVAEVQDFQEVLDDYILKEEHPKEAWSEAADLLMERLENDEGPTRDYNYGRGQFGDFAITALKRSERDDEIIPLCEREARQILEYNRLVNLHLAAGRLDEAKKWIAIGVDDTRYKLRGVAHWLLDSWLKILTDEKNWPRVVVHWACEFAESLSTDDYLKLKAAAKKIKRWPEIQGLIMEYLSSGTLPWQMDGWNLPGPDKFEWPRDNRRFPRQFPASDILIALAIVEDNPDEVLRLHDDLSKNDMHCNDELESKIAETLKELAPEKALAIWKRLAEKKIENNWIGDVMDAKPYLKKAGHLMANLRRKTEWRGYLKKLRSDYRHKHRMADLLNSL
jgi:uncharacterized Zn finger protein